MAPRFYERAGSASRPLVNGNGSPNLEIASPVEFSPSRAFGFQDIADVTSKAAIVPLTPKSGHLKGNNNGNTVSLEKSGAAEKPSSRQVRAGIHNPFWPCTTDIRQRGKQRFCSLAFFQLFPQFYAGFAESPRRRRRRRRGFQLAPIVDPPRAV